MHERLIELRKYFDMSQQKFASKMGMSQSTYAPLESGKRHIRDAYILLICQAYMVNEEWLRHGTGDMLAGTPNKELDELLGVYDNLTPKLKSYLLKQARGIQDLQDELDSE